MPREPYRSQALEFAVSAGRSGKAPEQKIKAFPQGGMVVLRSDWPSAPAAYARAAYLAQQCAFHSRVHKHADDLTFIWHDRGSPILVDAGRFGYVGKTEPGSELFKQGFWYNDPKRMYVESTRAHNTVEIDGKNHDRTKRKPYGSALLRSGESDGVLFAESEVRHSDSVRHARVLMMRPHEWLIVFDWLWANDKKPHDFRQWFQFSPKLEVSVRPEGGLRAEGVKLRIPLISVDLIAGPVLMSPIKGQEDPVLQGWWSPEAGEFDPIWSACWEQRDVPTATFATLFAFGNDVSVDRDHNQVNPSGRTASFRWTQDSRTFELHLERPNKGDLQIKCAVSNAATRAAP
jgi:hypothetical protein